MGHPFLAAEFAAAFAEGLSDGLGIFTVPCWEHASFVRRGISGTRAWDLASPYPFLPYRPTWVLREGIELFRRSGAVSAVVVTDPLHPFPTDVYQTATLTRMYKRHHIVERRSGYRPSEHHRSELRKAARRGVDVDRRSLSAYLDLWTRLYSGFIADRAPDGALHRFARRYHEIVARAGADLWTCWVGGEIACAAVWLRVDNVAYYHLAASNAMGRSVSAGYVAVDAAVRALLAEDVDVVLLGSGLARVDEPACGLERFKAGFATGCTTNMLLGFVLRPEVYVSLCRSARSPNDYFPGYRAPAASGSTGGAALLSRSGCGEPPVSRREAGSAPSVWPGLPPVQ